MGEVVVVQVVVVVLGEVVRVLDVRAAVAVVHVQDVRLAVLRVVVVEDGGEVGDGRRVRVGVGVGVLERVRERV